MSIGWLVTNLFAALLLPPLNGLLLLLAGWWLWERRPPLARTLMALSILLLWLQALPAVGNVMLRSLEGEPDSSVNLRQAQAIVVLGAGRHLNATEYGGDTVGEATLLRLRYAAKLHRESGLPVLVTGGKPDGGEVSEAEIMQGVLEREFGVPVRWVEGESNNTRENAEFSAKQLTAVGVSKVLLVTHAWHMPRAVASFSAAGLVVVPAATEFSRSVLTALDFLPSSYTAARHALHEWIGLVWYRLPGKR